MFLEISQNSQENTCASVFFNKVAGPYKMAKHTQGIRLQQSWIITIIGKVNKTRHLRSFKPTNWLSLFDHFVVACNFIKKEFSCEFCEIFKTTFFTEHLWVTASVLEALFMLESWPNP